MADVESLIKRLSSRKAPRLHVAVDIGDGPVIVLIHGIASSSVTWQKLIPRIDGRYRVIAIDILGHGESPVPLDAEYTIEEHVDAVHATIKSLRLREPFVLVGHSMGALIASRYAATRPSRIRHLVLVGLPVYPPVSGLSDRRVKARIGTYLRAYEFLRNNKQFALESAALIAPLLPIKGVFEITERNWVPFVRSLENCIESQTVISDIARARMPIDIVYGGLDQFMVPGSMEILERMSGVTMHRVEASDHLVRRRLAAVIARVIDERSSESANS